MVMESNGTEPLALGLKLGSENMVSKSLDNIVGNLWQAARQESSGSSLDNTSPRNEDLSDGDQEILSPGRRGSASPEEQMSQGTVRLKDQRDLIIKEDLMDKDPRRAFLAGLPNFGGIENFNRHQRDFLNNSTSLLQAAAALRTPPNCLPGSYTPIGSGNTVSSQPPTPSSQTSSPSGQNNFNSSQQNWSFEEQFKQLYEIDDNPKRKDFLDELFTLMQKRGTPINRLPIMAKQVLDLYELFNLVCARGGLVEVINKKLWQEVIKGLGLPSSITSAAFTLRTQYTKYLYPLECIKRNLSSPTELQIAIEGNKREGRRSSYGAYSDMASMQSFPGLPPQISPLSLVNQRPNSNGFPTSPPNFSSQGSNGGAGSQDSPLSPFDMTRLTLWKMYNNTGQPMPPNFPSGFPVNFASGFASCMDSLSNSSLERDRRRREEREEAEEREALHREIEIQRKEQQQRIRAAAAVSRNEHEELEVRRDNREEEEEQEEEEEEETFSPPAKRRNHQDIGKSDENANDEEENNIISVHDSPRKITSGSGGLPGANIKIASRGDGRTEDASLVVSMEINGITYQGVLFVKDPSKSS